MSTVNDQSEYRAIVVDDDPIVRRMVTFALQQEEISCDTAADGEEALTLLKEELYDLIVTDLQMPKRHGHALVVAVLESQVCPKIIVHTAIDDPRLTKDLMLRGVHDVFYKPANYAAFAAKARGLVVREREMREDLQLNASPTGAKGPFVSTAPDEAETVDHSVITISDMKSTLSDHSKVLPVSTAAIEVSRMIRSDLFNAEQIAAVVQQDEALSEKILRIANTPFYNTTGKPLTSITQAVTRVGQKRIGEFALALSTLASLTPESLPWMNLDLAWRRSVAAGIAIELLIAQGNHQSISEGLVFSALMHNSARIVMGLHYPEQYDSMVKHCEKTGTTLLHQERLIFPKCHFESMCELLTEWEIPDTMSRPLRHVSKDFLSLSTLPEPVRTRVELVKLAILIGDISVGNWQTWDAIEIPDGQLLDRLKIDSVSAVLIQTREQLQGILGFNALVNGKPAPDGCVMPPTKPVTYVNASEGRFDFLAEILPAMGINLKQVELKDHKLRGSVLINRIGVTPQKSISKYFADFDKAVFIRDSENIKRAGRLGTSIAVPCSFAVLQKNCREACIQ